MVQEVGDILVNYEHHGANVWVRKSLKGRHREHCLCYICDHFNPGSRDTNCPIANALYQICVSQNVTTPVWECAQFSRKAPVATGTGRALEN